jgi:hypothetical protein
MITNDTVLLLRALVTVVSGKLWYSCWYETETQLLEQSRKRAKQCPPNNKIQSQKAFRKLILHSAADHFHFHSSL